jgi:hypothetical protein
MPSLIYKDDIGARLVIDTENHTMATTTTFTIIMKKPSETVVTLTPPSGGVDVTTGTITYPTVSGDLNEAGEYQVQVHAVFDDGDNLKSNRDTFLVYDVIS